MPVLSSPVITASREDWEMLGGGANSTLVEYRSSLPSSASSATLKPDADSGKGGNSNNAQTAGAIDLFEYRIAIYVPRDAAPETPKNNKKGAAPAGGAREQSPPNVMRADILSDATQRDVKMLDQIYVVAVGSSREEIFEAWEQIKDGWRETDGAVDVTKWADFYQRIIRMAEDAKAESGDAVENMSDAFLDDQGSPAGTASAAAGSTPVDAAGGANESFTGTSVLLAGEGISDKELWVARALAAWYWNDIYQSIVLLAIFAHGWWLGWMNIYIAITVVGIMGYNFPHYVTNKISPNETTNETIQRQIDQRADLLRRLVFQARDISAFFLGGRETTTNEIRSRFATLVLINFVVKVVFSFDAVDAIEAILLCPSIVGTLVAGLFLSKIFGVEPPQVPESSPAVSPQRSTVGRFPSESIAASAGAPNTAAVAAGSSSPTPRAPPSALKDTATKHITTEGSSDTELANSVPLHFELRNASGWTFVKEKEDVKFYSKSVPWTDKKACKFTMTVPGVTAGTLEHILCDDPNGDNLKSYAYTFDRLLSKKKVPSSMNDGKRNGTKIVHTQYKSPVWGVSARDLVSKINIGVYLTPEEQVQFKIVPAVTSAHGRLAFLQSGEDYGNQYPKSSGHQRGAAHRYGFLGVETAHGLEVTLTLSVDPCGRIPASLVELTNAEQIEKMIIIRRLMKEKGPMEPTLPTTLSATAGNAPTTQQDTAVDSGATPQPQQQQQLPKFYERFFELYNNCDWEHVKDKDGVSFKSVTIPWCDKKACQFQVFVPGVTAASLESMATDDPDCTNKSSTMYTYDGMLNERFMVKKIDDNNAIVHHTYKSPVWGIAPRDICLELEFGRFLTERQQKQLNIVADSGAKDVFIQCGVDKHDGCPDHKGHQRGKLFFYGLTGRETKNGLEVTLTISLDPCGRVPAKLVEMTNAEQIEKLIKIRKILLDMGPIKREVKEQREEDAPTAVAATQAKDQQSNAAAPKIVVLGAPQSGRATFMASVSGSSTVPTPPHKQQPALLDVQLTGQNTTVHELRGANNDDCIDTHRDAIASADGIIYILDAAGSLHLQKAKSDLETLTKLPSATGAPILVLGNKTDVHGHMTEDELSSTIPALLSPGGGPGSSNRPILLFMCSLAQKTGVNEGLKWLMQTSVGRARRSTLPTATNVPAGPAVSKAVTLWSEKLFHSADWKFKLEKDGVTFHEMPSPFVDFAKNKILAVKFECFVPGVTSVKALDILLNDIERVKQFDRLIDSKTELKKADDTPNDVYYHSKYKSPVWGVAPRDMCTRVTSRTYLKASEEKQLIKLDDKNIGDIFLHVGFDASKEIPTTKGFVRSEVHCFGFMARKDTEKDGIIVTNSFSIDPCGSIPKSIVAAGNVEQVEKLRIIRQLLTEMPKDVYQ